MPWQECWPPDVLSCKPETTSFSTNKARPSSQLPSRLALPGLVHPQIVTPVLWRQQIVVPIKCQVWSCWQQRGKNRHSLVQPLQLVPPPRFNPRNHRGKTTTWSLRAFSKELRLITLKLPDQAKSCIMLACMIILIDYHKNIEHSIYQFSLRNQFNNSPSASDSPCLTKMEVLACAWL